LGCIHDPWPQPAQQQPYGFPSTMGNTQQPVTQLVQQLTHQPIYDTQQPAQELVACRLPTWLSRCTPWRRTWRRRHRRSSKRRRSVLRSSLHSLVATTSVCMTRVARPRSLACSGVLWIWIWTGVDSFPAVAASSACRATDDCVGWPAPRRCAGTPYSRRPPPGHREALLAVAWRAATRAAARSVALAPSPPICGRSSYRRSNAWTPRTIVLFTACIAIHVGPEASLNKYELLFIPRGVPRGNILNCVFVGGGRRPTIYSVSVTFARAGIYVKEARTLKTAPNARQRSWVVVAACRMKIPTIITMSKMQAIISEYGGRSYSTTLIRFEMTICDMNIYIDVYIYIYISLYIYTYMYIVICARG
jgi:hypothetical protein